MLTTLGCLIAAAIRADGKLSQFVQERYGSWDSGIGKRIDVVTEGPFVERSAPIRVVAVEGVRVVVRALSEQSKNVQQTKSINS